MKLMITEHFHSSTLRQQYNDPKSPRDRTIRFNFSGSGGGKGTLDDVSDTQGGSAKVMPFAKLYQNKK